MKIVLFGSSGQLGLEWQAAEARLLKESLLLPYNSSMIDVTHHERVRDELREQQPDLVVNCAAYTNVDGAETNREIAQQVNAKAVAHLAECCSEIGAKLIHYSTDYVFPGRAEDQKQYPDGYSEDHPADPINHYGQTKWEGEEAVRQNMDDYLIVRLSWLCGQFGDNFVKTMIQLGKEREKLQVVNDQFGSPTFTENVVRNSWQLVQSHCKGTYHITSEGTITWYDFARAIFSLSDIEVEIEPVDSTAFSTKAQRPFFSKLNTQKLHSVEGCEIKPWRESLQQLLKKL